jgi:hypothetical protein
MANFRIVGGLNPEQDIEQGLAGGTILANSFIKMSSTSWVQAGDGESIEGWAIDSATSGNRFKFTRKNGLLVSVTGALAVNALAYASGAQAVDAGSQNNKSCGYVIHTQATTGGLDPETSTNNVVRMHFPANVQTTHA